MASEFVLVGKARSVQISIQELTADHLVSADGLSDPFIQLASFDPASATPDSRGRARRRDMTDLVVAGLAPLPSFDARPVPQLPVHNDAQVAAMLPVLPQFDQRPAANLSETRPPLLEPFMDVFEDWVTKSPINRHPGFEKVHFAPNVEGRCLPSTLINVLYEVGSLFGDVNVISGYRNPSHNRAVGGATHSLHMECRAIDFFVGGTGVGVVDWLVKRKDVGGYKRYPFGSFHIDNGPRRTWSWPIRRSRRR